MSTTTVTFQFPISNSSSTTPSTQGLIDVASLPVQATGSTRSSGSLYTIAIHAVGGYEGRLFIEGSLANNPTDSDWVPIMMPGLTTSYVGFPNSDFATSGGATIAGFSFRGSFAWLRVRQYRSYGASSGGYLTKIDLNLGTWVVNPNLPAQRQTLTGIQSVVGNNLGDGEKIYSGFNNGSTNVVLDFKTLKAGNSISFRADATSITIDSLATPGGEGGVTKFVELDDFADKDVGILSNAVLFGQYDALHWTPQPGTPGQVLTFTANGLNWAMPPVTSWGTDVRDENVTIFPAAKTLNFIGNGVTVTNQSGVPTINIPGVGNPTGSGATEYVTLLYTPGSNGNLSATDAILESSTGITRVDVIDQAQCIVEFEFAFQNMPPMSIAVMGQVYNSNEFIYSNIASSSSPSRRIKSGGTADAPTLLEDFGSAIIRLQLRPQDVGANAPAGQRSRCVVLFRF